MTTITTLEYALLNKMAHDEHQPDNGATPECFDDTSAIWAVSIVRTSEDKGVFSSLLKKGLVGHMIDEDGNQCWMTREGFNAWQEQHELDQWEPVSPEEQERILTEEAARIHARKGA